MAHWLYLPDSTIEDLAILADLSPAKMKALREDAERIAGFVRANRSLLVSLFADVPTHDLSEKVRELESGPLPHLDSFRTYLDLRPIYDAGATTILEYRAVIMLGLTIHS